VQAGLGKVSSGLLIIPLAAPAAMMFAIEAGREAGPAGIATLAVIGGIVQIVVGRGLKYLRPYFPSEVCGVVVLVLGLSMIPAVVREMDDREMLEIAIIENVQRSDLNAVEEAEAYKALIDRFGRTQESVAQQVGKSREHVSNTLRLLSLPDDVREHVREGRMTAGHGRALLKTSDPSGFAATVIAKQLSVRDTEALSKADKAGGRGDIKAFVDDKDVDTKALEMDLQRALGLDVDIRHVNGKGGEVRIKYAQLEQLDEICRLLSRPRVTPSAN
jgi:ParB family chromosome partitioning protein